MQKALIRNNFPPQIAERMCAAIDSKEKVKLFRRLLIEWNERMLYQQMPQAAVMEFLRGYKK